MGKRPDESQSQQRRLTGAEFSGAHVALMVGDSSDVDFGAANLTGADLSGSDLRDATITDEQLAQCETLEGATMPNRQKYENWLKSKTSGEDR